MRKATQSCVDLIKMYEGFSSKVYICPAGYKTIGYGHLVRNDESFDEISKEEAEQILISDLSTAEYAVLRLIEVPLSDGQFDALVSFTFNLGSGQLQSSTLRRKLNRGEYQSAHREFKRWVFAGGKKLQGLVNRRAAEAALFLA